MLVAAWRASTDKRSKQANPMSNSSRVRRPRWRNCGLFARQPAGERIVVHAVRAGIMAALDQARVDSRIAARGLRFTSGGYRRVRQGSAGAGLPAVIAIKTS